MINWKLLVYVCIASILLSTCKQDNSTDLSQEKQKIIDSLITENNKLKTKAENSEQSLNDFMQAFNDINQNLEEIKRKEDIISMKALDMESGKVGTDKIQEDILVIYELLQENKETVNELRAKLEASDMINEEMQRSLNLLSRSIERKNDQILNLRKTLDNLSIEMQCLNQSLDSVMAKNHQKDLQIKAQKEILNSGYYIIGTPRELYRLGITTKKGGFAGIGSTSQIDDHFESGLFTKIDIHQTKTIPLNFRKVRILSTHPAQAYKFSGPEELYEDLIITRPDNFWSTSRYLVIEVDN